MDRPAGFGLSVLNFVWLAMRAWRERPRLQVTAEVRLKFTRPLRWARVTEPGLVYVHFVNFGAKPSR